jgi:hypothetical protein
MKNRCQFIFNFFVVIALAYSLSACATGPIIADGKLKFPDYKFSVDSLPTEWKLVEPTPPGAIIAWKNNATYSLIGITANKVAPSIRLQTVIESYKVGMTKGIPDAIAKNFSATELSWAKNISVTIEEEKDIKLGEMVFHRIVINYGGEPVKGVSVNAKRLSYFFKSEGFIYSVSLQAILGYYEKDMTVIEQMMRGFSIIN